MRVLVSLRWSIEPSARINFHTLPIHDTHSQFIVSIVIGVAVGGLVPATPLVYTNAGGLSTVQVVEPRKAYEYTSSVQTADYANYASVESDNAGLATATVVAPAPAPAPAPLIALHRSVAAPFYTHFVQPPPVALVPSTPVVQVKSLAAPKAILTPTPLVRTATLVQPAPIVETTVVEHAAAPIVPASPLLVVTKSQYHAQDSFGQAAYGHSEALQTHNAVQDAAGNKAGSYSYVAPDGRVLTTDYVADENGYRVATNALPIDVNHPQPQLVAHLRRRRSLVAVATAPAATLAIANVPVVKEATRTDIAGHSSTVRLDTYNAHVLAAVPAVHHSTVYATAPVVPHLTYATAYHVPAATYSAYSHVY